MLLAPCWVGPILLFLLRCRLAQWPSLFAFPCQNASFKSSRTLRIKVRLNTLTDRGTLVCFIFISFSFLLSNADYWGSHLCTLFVMNCIKQVGTIELPKESRITVILSRCALPCEICPRGFELILLKRTQKFYSCRPYRFTIIRCL